MEKGVREPGRVDDVENEGGDKDASQKRERDFPADKPSDHEIDPAQYKADTEGGADAADLSSQKQIHQSDGFDGIETEVFQCANGYVGTKSK